MADSQPLERHYLTRPQLAEYLGVSVSTVQRLEKQGLPSVLWGRRIRRFVLPEVLAWLDEHGQRSPG